MKFVRLVSDLHLDFDTAMCHRTRLVNPAFDAQVQREGDLAFLWWPTLMVGDEETTLVIAGDLWDDRKFLRRKFSNGESWLKRISNRFKYVVFVLGNHDYWGANLTLEPPAIKQELAAQGIANVHLLECSTVVLDQVKFTGGTLWTDHDHGNPLITLRAPMVMAKDFTRIKVGKNYRRLKVSDQLKIFADTKRHIFENSKRDHPEQKVIVVTHMAPTAKSIAPHYLNDKIGNFYYYSDLTPELCYTEHEIDLWFHGHTHAQADYEVGPTRVICNPRGYAGYENIGFQPELRIEL